VGSNPISSTKCIRAPQHGELLHKSRMAVFPHHTRANECCQLAGHAASRVVPGTLQDHRAFPCKGILPDLAEFYGSAVRRAESSSSSDHNRRFDTGEPPVTRDSKALISFWRIK
jgi:hypothetical protein